ncbi:MAG TPA: FGGY family carbohydrate kinase [Tepidisphaeraceae bacterium]|jgi:xylulokinase|nr:FGGY family carbohydrate kinase [Tepidisphaeraceae bacterium]
MPILGLDIGSSSVKTAVLRETKIVGEVATQRFKTRYDGARSEVSPDEVLKAVRGAIGQLGAAVKKVDAVAISVMSPAWVAMDSRGKALTPLVTHQDRRSVAEAHAIEQRVGKARHLKLAGNRPFPGGISSTTWAWYRQHEAERLKNADLVGHLNTYLHRHMTGKRVIDPSNASFTGFYETVALTGWSDELCDASRMPKALLPQVLPSNAVGGNVSKEGARRFGLPEGLPVLAGIVDGSCGMLLAGAKAGQLFNVSGSTDVLALCVDRPQPHDRLLTRALGVDQKWVSVSTIAAVGTALNWARDQFFADLPEQKFWKLVSSAKRSPGSRVAFENHLAGDRTQIDQRTGCFTGITLATTREEMLSAIVDSLARDSAARLELLRQPGVSFRRRVMVAGGVGRRLSHVLHRDWPGRWEFVIPPEEATLRGLGMLKI